jgi:hypothetical protein
VHFGGSWQGEKFLAVFFTGTGAGVENWLIGNNLVIMEQLGESGT